MITVTGVVTFAAELESKRSPGETYRLVNIDGLRVFPIAEIDILPATGQHIEAQIGINRREDGRDNMRLYSWKDVPVTHDR